MPETPPHRLLLPSGDSVGGGEGGPLAEDAADGRNDIAGDGRAEAEIGGNLLGEPEIQCVVVFVDAQGESRTILVRVQVEGG